MVEIEFVPRQGYGNAVTTSQIHYEFIYGEEEKILTSIIVFLYIPRWSLKKGHIQSIGVSTTNKHLTMTPPVRILAHCLSWESTLWAVAQHVGVDETIALDQWVIQGDYNKEAREPFPFSTFRGGILEPITRSFKPFKHLFKPQTRHIRSTANQSKVQVPPSTRSNQPASQQGA